MALNSALMLALDGPIDPLSVTRASVSARRSDGRDLAAQVETSGGQLVLQLVVDAELLADPPESVALTVLGLPSPHALSTLDGRRLAATTRVDFTVTAGLEARGRSPARLVELGGQSPRPALELSAAEPLRLVIDGVLDPATLRPLDCPLFPLEQGLVLPTPLQPVTSWRCIGPRFELVLDLAGRRGRFQLDLRRFGWRDLAGGIPEPALVAEVVAP